MDTLWKQFCDEYPTEANTRETWYEWREIPDPLRGNVLAGLRRWKYSEEWKEEGGRYIPNAVNFLRREMWKQTPRAYREPYIPGEPTRKPTQEEIFERHHIHTEGSYHMYLRAQEIDNYKPRADMIAKYGKRGALQ